MARFKFGGTSMPSVSARSPGVGGVLFASEKLIVLLLLAPSARGAAVSAMPVGMAGSLSGRCGVQEKNIVG